MLQFRRRLLQINQYQFGQLKLFPSLDTESYTKEQVGHFIVYLNEVKNTKQIVYRDLEEGSIEVLRTKSLRDDIDILQALAKTNLAYMVRMSSIKNNFFDEMAQMNQQRLLEPFQEFIYLIYTIDNNHRAQYQINEILLKKVKNDEDINYLKQYKNDHLQKYIDFCLDLPIDGVLNEQYLVSLIQRNEDGDSLQRVLKQIIKQLNSIEPYQFKRIFKSVFEFLKKKENQQQKVITSLIKEIQQYCYQQIKFQHDLIIQYGSSFLATLCFLQTFNDIQYHKVLLEALMNNIDTQKSQNFYYVWLVQDIIRLNTSNSLKYIQEQFKVNKNYRDHMVEKNLIEALPILVLDNYQLELDQLLRILDFLTEHPKNRLAVTNLFVLLFRSTQLLKGLSTDILDRLIKAYNNQKFRILNTITLSVNTAQVCKEIKYILTRIDQADTKISLIEYCKYLYYHRQLFEQFPNLIQDSGLNTIFNQAFIKSLRAAILNFFQYEQTSYGLMFLLLSYSILCDVNDLKPLIEDYLQKYKSVHYLKQILKSSVKYRELLQSSKVMDQFKNKDDYIDIYLKQKTFDAIKNDNQIQPTNQDSIQFVFQQLMDYSQIKEYDETQLHHQLRKIIQNFEQLSWIQIYHLVSRLSNQNLNSYELLYKLRKHIILLAKLDLDHTPQLSLILNVYEKVVQIQHHFQEEDLDSSSQQSINGQFFIETIRRINGYEQQQMDIDNSRLLHLKPFFPYYYNGQKDFIKYYPTNTDKLMVAQFLYDNNIRFQIDIENMQSYLKTHAFLPLEKLINLLYLAAQIDDQDTQFIIDKVKQNIEIVQPQKNYLLSHQIMPTVRLLKKYGIKINKNISNIIFNSMWNTPSSIIFKDIMLGQIFSIQTYEQIEDQVLSLK